MHAGRKTRRQETVTQKKYNRGTVDILQTIKFQEAEESLKIYLGDIKAMMEELKLIKTNNLFESQFHRYNSPT